MSLKITSEKKKEIIYENPGVTIYPHAVAIVKMPPLIHAVFRMVSKTTGFTAFMSITGNKCVAPLEEGWEKIWEDFFIFCRKAEITTRGLALGDFFKQKEGEYSKGDMQASIDLLPFIAEMEEINKK